MPGYILIEQKYLLPPISKNKGLIANSRRIGFLDFLREIQGEPFPYHDETKLLVAGLEDVLLFSRPEMEKTARIIHQILQKAAGNFEKRSCPDVQIVFRCELKRGEKLKVIHPAEELPVYIIFGSPAADSDSRGNPFYKCSFNLSSVS